VTAPAFLSVTEFAELTRVPRSTAYAGVKDGSVPHVVIGGAIRIPAKWLDETVEKAIAQAQERVA
jgi:excisionase family DNA binding protein